MSKRFVAVGMSGGVDSSVAAMLLKREGHRVEGLFMDNWDDDDAYCSTAGDFQDALQVCDELGIPLHRVSFAAEYRERVFAHFLAEYSAGRTPNPDVLCNREIKFDLFLDYATRLGADAIATGHYARLVEADDGVHLLRAKDEAKDQTYFLHAVPANALARSVFPLGGLDKGTVRKLAMAAGFDNFAKKDSTGICFIGERPFREFLAKYLPERPGDIVDEHGRRLGRHDGLMAYTLGQRQGLGIGGVKDAVEAPWFVIGKSLDDNRLVVAQDHDHPALLREELVAEDLCWVNAPPVTGRRLHGQVRYRQRAASCVVAGMDDDRMCVVFEAAQWAPTPGQYLVLYDDEECLGGGVIQ